MQVLQGFDEYLEILDFEDEELLRQEVLKELETGIIIPQKEQKIFETFQALKLPNIYADYSIILR